MSSCQSRSPAKLRLTGEGDIRMLSPPAAASWELPVGIPADRLIPAASPHPCRQWTNFFAPAIIPQMAATGLFGFCPARPYRPPIPLPRCSGNLTCRRALRCSRRQPLLSGGNARSWWIRARIQFAQPQNWSSSIAQPRLDVRATFGGATNGCAVPRRCWRSSAEADQ